MMMTQDVAAPGSQKDPKIRHLPDGSALDRRSIRQVRTYFTRLFFTRKKIILKITYELKQPLSLTSLII